MTVQEILSDKYIQELIDTSKQVWDVEDWNPGCATIRHSFFKVNLFPIDNDRISIECINENYYPFCVEFDNTKDLRDYIFHVKTLPRWVSYLPIDLRRVKPIKGRKIETCIIDDLIEVYSFEYGCEYEPQEEGFSITVGKRSFSVMGEEGFADAIMLLLDFMEKERSKS